MEGFDKTLWDKSDIFIKQIQDKFGDKVDCHDYANLKVYIDYLVLDFLNHVIFSYDGFDFSDNDRDIAKLYLEKNHYKLINFKNYIFEHFIGE